MLPKFKLPTFWQYTAITSAYSLARTIHSVWDAKHHYTNKSTNKLELRPMLLTHKLATCAVAAITGPWLWAYHAYWDLTDLECYLRGKDPDEYGV